MSATTSTAMPALASPRGLLLGAAAYTLFSIHDALVKAVVSDLPVPEILLLRSIVIALICLGMGRGRVVAGLIHSDSKHKILGRAVLTLAAWVMYYSQASHMTLAKMTTLYYFAPVLTMVLAVVFLKEKLTLARAGAASIGFFGVLVACDPAGIEIGWPTIFVLSAAFCWAVASILMRSISRGESALVQVLALNLFNIMVMSFFVLGNWHPIGWRDFAFIIAAGVVGGSGQYVLVEAARRVPAGVLGTVEYSSLVWAFVLGYLFWGEKPVAAVYLGALLIVMAGLLVAWSETRNRRILALADAPAGS
ncbi:MAG TPA: DMT family transporter [Devosia sp.]|nr:DMT family transporter [Devosia sp.]